MADFTPATAREYLRFLRMRMKSREALRRYDDWLTKQIEENDAEGNADEETPTD
jgi:hypothetical protein